MLAVQPANTTTAPQWPRALTLAPYQGLKRHQIQKIALVALACLLLGGFQFSGSLLLTLGITLACCSLTLLSETFLRKDDPKNSHWLNFDFDKTDLIYEVAFRLLFVPILLSRSIVRGEAPPQKAVGEFMKGNPRMILGAIVSAPIAEEILFRGFLQERIEDLFTLVGRVVGPIPEGVKKYGAILLQAIAFAALHITGTQVVQGGMKSTIFVAMTLAGLWLGSYKSQDKSLISPMVAHASGNTGVVLGALAGAYLKRRMTPVLA